MTVGTLLRQWRVRRRVSQSRLALDAEVSTRHISCLENGKARPSREMVLVLTSALEVPLGDRNLLLAAAGFAPAYRETPLDDPSMAPVNRVVDLLLRQAEPFGAALLDGGWDVLRMNTPMQRMLAVAFAPEPVPASLNVIRMVLEPGGMRPWIVNFEELATELLLRLRREVLLEADPAVEELLEEMSALPGLPDGWRRPEPERSPSLWVPVHLKKGPIEVRFITSLTTIGTPQDVTTAGLRIEQYWPADAATEAFARALAEG
ncbi:MAG: transcriptional regulator with XRE-family HTH domain [Myxococcota bacterium]|jgi:transcriptional regulator with XRE-family HTH domain